MTNNTPKHSARVSQAIADLDKIKQDYHDQIINPLRGLTEELDRIQRLYASGQDVDLTDEYLISMGFVRKKLFDGLGDHYMLHNVLVAINPHSQPGDTFRYKLGITEQRGGTTHVAMFRWIGTQADLHDMYFAIRNETLEPGEGLPF